ncbi:MAG: hypothetical protein ABSC63_19260 [Candidatus Binataceae bacterium]
MGPRWGKLPRLDEIRQDAAYIEGARAKLTQSTQEIGDRIKRLEELGVKVDYEKVAREYEAALNRQLH